MFDWKQRLYAFLLRRLLGPWLEEGLWQEKERISLLGLATGLQISVLSQVQIKLTALIASDSVQSCQATASTAGV